MSEEIPATRPHRLLVAACASVSVLALPQYLMAIRRLETPIELHVVLSDNAANMIPAESIAPFCDEVHTPGRFWSKTSMGHIGLARWPDLMAVLPASCDILARTAAGFADKPIALLTAAHSKPVMFFPNTNASMWEKPITQRNVQLVKEGGHLIVEPLREQAFAAAAGQFEFGYVLPPTATTAQMLLDELNLRAKQAQHG